MFLAPKVSTHHHDIRWGAHCANEGSQANRPSPCEPRLSSKKAQKVERDTKKKQCEKQFVNSTWIVKYVVDGTLVTNLLNLLSGKVPLLNAVVPWSTEQVIALKRKGLNSVVMGRFKSLNRCLKARMKQLWEGEQVKTSVHNGQS